MWRWQHFLLFVAFNAKWIAQKFFLFNINCKYLYYAMLYQWWKKRKIYIYIREVKILPRNFRLFCWFRSFFAVVSCAPIFLFHLNIIWQHFFCTTFYVRYISSIFFLLLHKESHFHDCFCCHHFFNFQLKSISYLHALLK